MTDIEAHRFAFELSQPQRTGKTQETNDEENASETNYSLY